MKKYCKNCKEETERYSSGHCKLCIKRRNEAHNKKRNSMSQKYLNYEKVSNSKEVFNKDNYKRLDIRDVITSSKDKYIYLLVSGLELVYVGKSNGNLLARINSHIKDKDFDDVLVIPVNDINTLNKFERKYISKYRPKLNKEFIFNGITYDIFDLKTEEKITGSKNDLKLLIGCSEQTLTSLLNENQKKIYSRYVLYKNRPKESNFKNILDTHTGTIERHNYITFAEKVNKPQNQVWYFMNGITKSFNKKRYIIVD